MSTFEGAVAVVTGGAAGIGRALALEAARRGAKVMVGDIGDASATVKVIEAQGGQARWVHCDVGVKADVVALHDATLTHFGAVNVVCSNVSIGVPGALHASPDEEFERIMRVNVTGSYWMLQAFAPDLIAAAETGAPAHILFTGSEHSLGVPPTDAPPFVAEVSIYTMSKHAILGIAAVGRRDLAGEGVHVAILCPGWTATERLRAMAETNAHLKEIIESMGQEPPVVAGFAFDGLERGEHIIPTNPVSRDFVVATHQEIIDAMEAVPAAHGEQK